MRARPGDSGLGCWFIRLSGAKQAPFVFCFSSTAYALILWPPSGPPGETPAPDSESSDLSNGTSDTISSGAAFGVVILIVAFMLAVLFTVFFKRKAIVKKFIMRRANRLERSTAVVTDPPAAQPTGQQGRTNPYVPLPQDLSVAASPGSVPSSAAATAGTQEQGATGPSEGNHSWRILPAYQPTPSPGRGCIQLELRSPVQVSMEGNGGAAIMALPGGKCVLNVMLLSQFCSSYWSEGSNWLHRLFLHELPVPHDDMWSAVFVFVCVCVVFCVWLFWSLLSSFFAVVFGCFCSPSFRSYIDEQDSFLVK